MLPSSSSSLLAVAQTHHQSRGIRQQPTRDHKGGFCVVVVRMPPKEHHRNNPAGHGIYVKPYTAGGGWMAAVDRINIHVSSSTSTLQAAPEFGLQPPPSPPKKKRRSRIPEEFRRPEWTQGTCYVYYSCMGMGFRENHLQQRRNGRLEGTECAWLMRPRRVQSLSS